MFGAGTDICEWRLGFQFTFDLHCLVTGICHNRNSFLRVVDIQKTFKGQNAYGFGGMLRGYSMAPFSLRVCLHKALLALLCGTWMITSCILNCFQSIISKSTYTKAQRGAVVCSACIHKTGVSQLQRSGHCVLVLFCHEWCSMLEAKHLRVAFRMLFTML